MSEYVYRQYCDHGQPIYYKDCSGCKAVKAYEAQIRYETYWAKRRAFFWDHFKQMFEGDVRDPDYKHQLPKEFNTLRTSNSYEELRKGGALEGERVLDNGEAAHDGSILVVEVR